MPFDDELDYPYHVCLMPILSTPCESLSGAISLAESPPSLSSSKEITGVELEDEQTMVGLGGPRVTDDGRMVVARGCEDEQTMVADWQCEGRRRSWRRRWRSSNNGGVVAVLAE
ncbi:hypothetical protein L1887_23861 [Cichorium endivia]|nr:hypothetical protein L1887_23861 [Cichorium endivia]